MIIIIIIIHRRWIWDCETYVYLRMTTAHQTQAMLQPSLEENVSRLHEWILAHFSEQYLLRVIAGPLHHVHLSAYTVPYACHILDSSPKCWEEVKRELDKDVRRGVICPILAGQTMEWCIRMVVVAKKLGKPRCTVDFQKPNACCQWEMHHIPTHSTWPLESHCILIRQWLTCTRVITR